MKELLQYLTLKNILVCGILISSYFLLKFSKKYLKENGGEDEEEE